MERSRAARLSRYGPPIQSTIWRGRRLEQGIMEYGEPRNLYLPRV